MQHKATTSASSLGVRFEKTIRGMIDYLIQKSARARNLRITIKADGTVTVTIPERLSLRAAETFVRQKESWIEKNILKIKKRNLIAGGVSVPKGTAKDLKEKKEQALALVRTRLQHFNTTYGFSWNNLSVKNTSSRWGSCSKRKNLSFSYRIIYLPEVLADYLVVHELCHIDEFNHSSNFWKLVEKTIPNYKKLRMQLRGIA